MAKPKDKRRKPAKGPDAMESEAMMRKFGKDEFVSFGFDKHKSKIKARKEAEKYRNSHKHFKDPSKYKGVFSARVTTEKDGHRVWKRQDYSKKKR